MMADSADVSIRHVFVYVHEPPYTPNLGHSSNLEARQYICPLLERFRVSVTFQGHNHCYEHSLVNGVHYLLTGGGALRSTTSGVPSNPGPSAERPAWSSSRWTSPGTPSRSRPSRWGSGNRFVRSRRAGVLSIFDAQGRKVDELLSATLPAGEGATYYRTRQLSGGTYFAVLRTAQDRRVTQFVVVR